MGDDGAPLTGSRSMSMELLPLMMGVLGVLGVLDALGVLGELSTERRRRSSGGRFRGWVLGSNFCLRDEDELRSVWWREERDGREAEAAALGSAWDAGREDFFGDLGEDEDFEGFVGEEDLVGDGGSSRVWWWAAS